MTTLEDVKLFVRVDGTENDAILTALMDAANEYILSATGTISQTALNDLCVKLLVKHWFDNDRKEVPHGIKSLLTHIEYTEV